MDQPAITTHDHVRWHTSSIRLTRRLKKELVPVVLEGRVIATVGPHLLRIEVTSEPDKGRVFLVARDSVGRITP